MEYTFTNNTENEVSNLVVILVIMEYTFTM